MKNLLISTIFLLIIPVWSIVYYQNLQEILYGNYHTYAPDKVYNVISGKCENCQDIIGQTRYDSVPYWSKVINKITEWSVLLLFPSIFILGLLTRKGYTSQKNKRILVIGTILILILCMTYFKAMHIALNV